MIQTQQEAVGRFVLTLTYEAGVLRRAETAEGRLTIGPARAELVVAEVVQVWQDGRVDGDAIELDRFVARSLVTLRRGVFRDQRKLHNTALPTEIWRYARTHELLAVDFEDPDALECMRCFGAQASRDDLAELVSFCDQHGLAMIRAAGDLRAPKHRDLFEVLPPARGTREGDLWAAIVEDPDDDALRLVYADWLEGCGRLDHARFIREHCAQAGGPRYLRVAGAPLPLPPLPSGIEWAIGCHRRGLPAELDVSKIDVLLERADEVFALAPIEALDVRGDDADVLARLAACPALAKIRELRCSLGHCDAAAIEALAGSPFATRLTTLDLSFGGITAAGLVALLSSRLAGQLVQLVLSSNFGYGAPPFPHLDAFELPRLERLDLTHNRLDGDELRRLLGSASLPSLVELVVAENPIGSGGVQVVATAALPQLVHLGLAKTHGKLRGLDALARRGGFETLDLQDNDLGPTAARRIATATRFGSLRYLDLGDNRIGNDGVLALVRSTMLPELKYLRLNSWELTPEVRAAFDQRFEPVGPAF